MAMALDERLERKYPYFGNGDPIEWDDGVDDYVAESGAALTPSGYEPGLSDFKNAHRAYEFQWHLGAILTALLEAGLTIDRFREYPYSNGAKLFDDMHENAGRRMCLPGAVPNLPLMFGLVATRH